MSQKMPFPVLREQATALRLEGKSRRQIKEILGIGSNETLGKTLRGVPPPLWTARPRAKDDLHAKARELRAQGRTYNEIAAELGVSKGSISLWVRDMPRRGRLSYEEFRERNATGIATYWATERPLREERRCAASERAAGQIGSLTEREIVIAGSVAYWCEGAKNKPYRRSDRVRFINSDPHLISFFLHFLAVVGVERERLICRVQIHESAGVEAAQQYWQAVTHVPSAQFRRPTLKRHNPKTVRLNTGDDYHGCLVIDVRVSTELYRQIEGWASAVMTASGQLCQPEPWASN